MKMIFGGIYRYKYAFHEHLDDQHYNIYIPCAYKNEHGIIRYRMVDTYMVQNPCWGNLDYEKRMWYLEQANCGETSWRIFFGCDDYYYRNVVEINSDELDENSWELIADLHDYKIVSDSEAKKYLEKDLLKYIPLWREDYYRDLYCPVGRIYVKKDAQIDGYKVYRKYYEDYPIELTSDYHLDDLERGCKEVLNTMTLGYGKKKEVKNTLKKIRKYRKLKKEFLEFCKSLNK